MKARCKHRGRPSALSSRLARRVTQLKQKAAAQRGSQSADMLHGSEKDASKSHCRQGGKGGGERGCIHKNTCSQGSTSKLSSPLFCLSLRAAAVPDSRSNREEEERSKAQSSHGHQPKQTSPQGQPSYWEARNRRWEEWQRELRAWWGFFSSYAVWLCRLAN